MENKSGFKQWNQDSRGRLKANPVKKPWSQRTPTCT